MKIFAKLVSVFLIFPLSTGISAGLLNRIIEPSSHDTFAQTCVLISAILAGLLITTNVCEWLAKD